MKVKYAIYTLVAASVLLASCARETTAPVNQAAQRYFNAWMHVNYPSLQKDDHIGVYVVEDKLVDPDNPKLGQVVGDSTFLFIDVSTRKLTGEYTSTNEVAVAKQLGTYDPYLFWGSNVVLINESTVSAGVEHFLKGKNLVLAPGCYDGPMKVGYRRTAIIPGWLTTSNRYDSMEQYLEKATGDDVIYEVTINDYTNDIIRWQIDTMERCRLFRELAGIDHKPDSSANGKDNYGFYFKVTDEFDYAAKVESGMTVSLNYTARLLDGYVFDTNIVDSAKVHHIYNSSRSYEPMKIKIGEKLSEYAAADDDSSSSESGGYILGFCKAISMMRLNESAVAMFYSNLGYGAASSSGKFPAYAPMIFEISIVDADTN